MPLDDNVNHTIQGMNPANPTDTDLLTEADNQLREIKTVLTENFPLFKSDLSYLPKELNDLEYFMVGTTDQVLQLNTSLYRPEPNRQSRAVILANDGYLSSGIPLVPLGSYYYSLIPPAKMAELYPDGPSGPVFVQPAGQLIPISSKYASLTKLQRVPNVFALTKSCFLRPSTGGLLLSSTNPFKTAANGLTLNVNTISQTHDHGGGAHTHSYQDNRGGKGTGTGEGRAYHNQALVQKTTGPVVLVNTTKPMISGYSHNHTVVFSDGGHETAPKHLLLYLYIRIN